MRARSDPDRRRACGLGAVLLLVAVSVPGTVRAGEIGTTRPWPPPAVGESGEVEGDGQAGSKRQLTGQTATHPLPIRRSGTGPSPRRAGAGEEASSGHREPDPESLEEIATALEDLLRATNLLEDVGHATELLGEGETLLGPGTDLLPALARDAARAARGEASVATSHLLEALVVGGLEKVPVLIERAVRSGALPAGARMLPTLFGVDEFLSASFIRARHGHLTVTELTAYLDGFSKLTAALAGGLIAGTAGARVAEKIVGHAQWLLRGLTSRLFEEAANKPVRRELLAQWRGLRVSSWEHGQAAPLLSEHLPRETLEMLGFSVEEIERLDEETRVRNRSLGQGREGVGLDAAGEEVVVSSASPERDRLSRTGEGEPTAPSGARLPCRDCPPSGEGVLPPVICPDGSPPPCGSGGGGVQHEHAPGQTGPASVGGVLLAGSATVREAGGALSAPVGSTFQILLSHPRQALGSNQLRRFVTALWAVYFGEEGPGISIDPIAPGVPRHLVRYIGHVVNSDLGRVMREADYLMKKWAVGTERPPIPGFRSVDELSATLGLRRLGVSRRFWFVPETMRFRLAGDSLIYDSGGLTLKTEYARAHPEGVVEPADAAYARFFTEHYAEIAAEYPVYRELLEYAKLVGLARHLKQEGAPLLWFLLANKDLVLTEDSPGTVEALVQKSKYLEEVEIRGGVDLASLSATRNYLYLPAEAIERPASGITRSDTERTPASAPVGASRGSTTLRVSGDRPVRVIDSQAVTVSSPAASGARYQTDVALRSGAQPGLELVRHYDPAAGPTTAFGPGWQLLLPYGIRPLDETRTSFRNVSVPREMVVTNHLTGEEEILAFDTERYPVAGYVPEALEESHLLGLFLLSDGSMRLADKLGSEYQFDGRGRLTEMVISEDYWVQLDHRKEHAGRQAFDVPPWRLQPAASGYEEVLGVRLPRLIRLLDQTSGETVDFTLETDHGSGVLGYVPGHRAGDTSFLAVLSDGSFQLEWEDGRVVEFGPSGAFRALRQEVISGLVQGGDSIQLDYELAGRSFRVRRARVLRKGSDGPIHTIVYDYDERGRLERASSSTGAGLAISYKGERIVAEMF